MYDFEAISAKEDPYPVYAALREHDPVYWHPAEKSWMISRYSDVAASLYDPRLIAGIDLSFVDQLSPAALRQTSRLFDHFRRWMVFSDSLDHKIQRAVTHKAISQSLTPEFFCEIKAISESLVPPTNWSRYDIMADFALPLASHVAARLLGLGNQHVSACLRITKSLFAILNFPLDDDLAREAQAVLDELELLTSAALASDDCKKPRGLMRAWDEAEQHSQMDRAGIIASVAQVLTGCVEPVSATIGNAVLALLKFPTEFERLQLHPEMINTAVEEFLRFEPPFLVAPRIVKTDFTLNGYQFAAGQRTLLLLGSANRDPNQFVEPEKLNITRSPNRHLSFGVGGHYCLALI